MKTKHTERTAEVVPLHFIQAGPREYKLQVKTLRTDLSDVYNAGHSLGLNKTHRVFLTGFFSAF